MIGQRCGVTIGNQMMMGGRRRRQVNMRMMFRAPNGVMGNATRLNGNFQYGELLSDHQYQCIHVS